MSETTTYYGRGISGRTVSIELPAVGEIAKVRAGSPKTRDLRLVTGRVVEHAVRSIPGTDFAVMEAVVESAAGERVSSVASRIGEITAEEREAYRAAAGAPC